MDYKTLQTSMQAFPQEHRQRQHRAAQENALRLNQSRARLLRQSMAADTFTYPSSQPQLTGA
jgi:hypothetical protein